MKKFLKWQFPKTFLKFLDVTVITHIYDELRT